VIAKKEECGEKQREQRASIDKRSYQMNIPKQYLFSLILCQSNSQYTASAYILCMSTQSLTFVCIPAYRPKNT